MAGFVPNQGEALIASLVCQRILTDRDADLEIGLFTNSSVSEATTLADLTEPTGGGYTRKTLTDGSWTGSGDSRAYAQQTFTATGGAYSAPVYGYFIATKAAGGTPRLLFIEVDGSGPFTMVQNASYQITPNVTVS